MYWIKGWQLQVGWSGRTFLNRWPEWQGKVWQGQVRRLWSGSELGKFHQNSEAVSEHRGLEEGSRRWTGATPSWSTVEDRAGSIDFIAQCQGSPAGGFREGERHIFNGVSGTWPMWARESGYAHSFPTNCLVMSRWRFKGPWWEDLHHGNLEQMLWIRAFIFQEACCWQVPAHHWNGLTQVFKNTSWAAVGRMNYMQVMLQWTFLNTSFWL